MCTRTCPPSKRCSERSTTAMMRCGSRATSLATDPSRTRSWTASERPVRWQFAGTTTMWRPATRGRTGSTPRPARRSSGRPGRSRPPPATGWRDCPSAGRSAAGRSSTAARGIHCGSTSTGPTSRRRSCPRCRRPEGSSDTPIDRWRTSPTTVASMRSSVATARPSTSTIDRFSSIRALSASLGMATRGPPISSSTTPPAG